MDMTKFESTLESIKPFVASSTSSNLDVIGANFRSRLMAMKEINDNINEFFKKNADFFIKNAPRQVVDAYTIDDGVRVVRYKLGKTSYVKYNKDDFDVILRYVNDEFKSVDINYIHDDYAKQLGCSTYEYDRTGIGSNAEGIFLDIFNGKYDSVKTDNIEYIDTEISRGEKYYNNVKIPMVEIFLNNIKEFQKSRCEKIRSLGTEPITKKVKIEIEYTEG